MEINHYAKGRGSQVSGFGDRRFAATRTKFINLLSLGIDWAMLIKSSSIQTTVVENNYLYFSNSTSQNSSTTNNNNINF